LASTAAEGQPETGRKRGRDFKKFGGETPGRRKTGRNPFIMTKVKGGVWRDMAKILSLIFGRKLVHWEIGAKAILLQEIRGVC